MPASVAIKSHSLAARDHLASIALKETRKPMGRNFVAEIKAGEAKLGELKAEMEKVCAEFVSEATPFLSKWYLEQAQAAVAKETEVTNGLPDDKLAALKQEVGVLVGRAQAKLVEELERRKAWWHRVPVGENAGRGTYYTSPRHLPSPVEQAMRYAMGHIAGVLEPYGFLHPDPRDRAGTQYRMWRKRGDGTGACYFPWSQSWPPELSGLTERYDALHRQAREAETGVATLNREKKETEAKSRWDSL